MTRLGATLVRRDRVAGRIAAAAAHPVTLLIAPAGCGKSTALQQHLASLQVPHARYDVRSEHGTLLGFARGLADATQLLAPGARASVADAVASALTLPAPGASLAMWMSNHLPVTPKVVAIDDFHHAQDDPQCVEMISALIERTKEHTRWIVASRSAQHLPVGSWVVYGDAAVPIDEQELRFTAEEARAAAEGIGSHLQLEDVERLRETTAGWATAFTLALRLSEYSPDVQSATATARRLSYEYLAEHVYRSLGGEERALLAVGALLEELDVAVLEAAGFDRAAPMLDELHRRLTFLTPVSESGAPASDRRYRCHDLFREFLLHSLELQGEDAGRQVRLIAATALEARGRVIEALRLYVRTGAHERIQTVLEAHGRALADRAHGDAVAAAIESLPEAVRAANPAVLGLRGYLEAGAGRYELARSLYERAIAACADRVLTAQLTAKLAGTLLNLGQDPAALLAPFAGDAGLAVSQRAELLSLLAVAHARFGRHDGLDALMDQVEELARDVDAEQARAQVLHLLGAAAILHGDAERAERVLDLGAELAIAHGMFRLATMIYTSLGSNAATNESDLPKSLAAARSALESAMKSGSLFLARFALARQIDIEVHRGDRDRLRGLLTQYGELPGPEHPPLAAAALWARAMQAAWESRFDEAAAAMIEMSRGSSFQEDALLAEAWCALFLVAAGRREEALAYVRQATGEGKCRTSRRISFGRARDVARAICALAETLAGRSTAARRILQRKASEPTAVTNALLDLVGTVLSAGGDIEPGALMPFFAQLAAQWHGGYGRAIEAVLVAHERRSRAAVTLTPSELSVLRSLASGRTPKEIALATGCSVHTVRWHIRQAISKFGCSGSDQALRAARAQGLLANANAYAGAMGEYI